MNDSIDPRVLAAELEASYGERASSQALIRMARSNADSDHAAVYRWEQAFYLLMRNDVVRAEQKMQSKGQPREPSPQTGK